MMNISTRLELLPRDILCHILQYLPSFVYFKLQSAGKEIARLFPISTELWCPEYKPVKPTEYLAPLKPNDGRCGVNYGCLRVRTDKMEHLSSYDLSGFDCLTIRESKNNPNKFSGISQEKANVRLYKNDNNILIIPGSIKKLILSCPIGYSEDPPVAQLPNIKFLTIKHYPFYQSKIVMHKEGRITFHSETRLSNFPETRVLNYCKCQVSLKNTNHETVESGHFTHVEGLLWNPTFPKATTLVFMNSVLHGISAPKVTDFYACDCVVGAIELGTLGGVETCTMNNIFVDQLLLRLEKHASLMNVRAKVAHLTGRRETVLTCGFNENSWVLAELKLNKFFQVTLEHAISTLLMALNINELILEKCNIKTLALEKIGSVEANSEYMNSIQLTEVVKCDITVSNSIEHVLITHSNEVKIQCTHDISRLTIKAANSVRIRCNRIESMGVSNVNKLVINCRYLGKITTFKVRELQLQDCWNVRTVACEDVEVLHITNCPMFTFNPKSFPNLKKLYIDGECNINKLNISSMQELVLKNIPTLTHVYVTRCSSYNFFNLQTLQEIEIGQGKGVITQCHKVLKVAGVNDTNSTIQQCYQFPFIQEFEQHKKQKREE